MALRAECSDSCLGAEGVGAEPAGPALALSHLRPGESKGHSGPAGVRPNIKCQAALPSRIQPHLPCGCSHDTPRTYADTAPGTALPLCNGHHLARCAHFQGQTFSVLWQVQRLAFHSPVAGTPPAPPFSPSRHHRQSPICPYAAPPVFQSS